jgi:hypothetical protein
MRTKTPVTLSKNLTAVVVLLALFMTPLTAFAQTAIKMRKTNISCKDITLGQQAAMEAEKQFPILNDAGHALCAAGGQRLAGLSRRTTS